MMAKRLDTDRTFATGSMRSVRGRARCRELDGKTLLGDQPGEYAMGNFSSRRSESDRAQLTRLSVNPSENQAVQLAVAMEF